MDNYEDEQSVPLTDIGKLQLVDNFANDEKPPPYGSLNADEPAQGKVRFKHSQSLPPFPAERLPRNAIRRIRSVPARASSATLARMHTLSTGAFSGVGPNDENQVRGNWDKPIEFFLSCLGYAVGLDSIWRFPYLCYRNGGGAFLIPYLLLLFGCGLPLMFMELALGQYSSEGPLTVWKVSPLFKGLGMGMVVCSVVLSVYHNMITGWSLYYLTMSLRQLLPWTCCEDEWSTKDCISFAKQNVCQTTGPAHKVIDQNFTIVEDDTANFAADEYFHNSVLGMADDFTLIGGMQLHLVVALLAAWVIVFLVLMKGIKSFGKAAYFTTTIPYIIMFVLLIRSLMEPGAIDGVSYFLKPDLSVLASAQVWGDAAAQVFYSMDNCLGGVITLASYNKFKHNFYRDAVVVAIANSVTAVFSGSVVFSILGFMAHKENTTIDMVATDGPGLTFIIYPQAVTILPLAPLWSALFFSMLIILALSTMLPTVENIVTALIDQWPNRLRVYKFWVMMAVCALCFLLGLPLTTSAGMYLLQLLDIYAVGYALLILGLVEMAVVSWRYGAGRLLNNIQSMLDRRPSIIWNYIWKFLTPSLLFFAVVLELWKRKPTEYGTEVFPAYASKIGWCLTSISILPIPIYAIYKLVAFKRSPEGKGVSLWRSLVTLSTPAADWAPALTKYRRVAQQYDGEDEVFA